MSSEKIAGSDYYDCELIKLPLFFNIFFCGAGGGGGHNPNILPKYKKSKEQGLGCNFRTLKKEFTDKKYKH